MAEDIAACLADEGHPAAQTGDSDGLSGWLFYCNKMDGAGSYDTAGGTIFYPASGYRIYSTGVVDYVGRGMVFWSAGPYSNDQSLYLSINSSSVRPLFYNYRSYGFAVRPVQE